MNRYLIILTCMILSATLSALSCSSKDGDGDDLSTTTVRNGYTSWSTVDYPIEEMDSHTDERTASPFSYTWAVEEDAGSSWFDDRAQRIRDCNQGLYTATEGRFRLSTQELVDKQSEGHVEICNLDSWYAIGTTSCGFMSAVYPHMHYEGTEFICGPEYYHIGLCGNFQVDIFLHEFCHGQFHRHPEEYGCSICVMGTYQRSRVVQLQHYCYGGDCLDGTDFGDCWGNWIIGRKYPNWTRTGSDPGTAPSITVNITDN